VTAYEYLIEMVGKHDSDECLIWPFQKDRDGYGRVTLPISLGSGHIKVASHRLAFKIIHGRWPEPCGLHTCDNPSCFNPQHIWEGNNRDNQTDKVEKGRQVKGSEQPESKLDEDVVLKIREEYSTGTVSMRTIAEKYNVTKVAIRLAIRGIRNWKHVNNAVSVEAVPRSHKTHCYRGHHLSKENCYIYGKTRQCKQCTAIRAKKRVKWDAARLQK
jgi:hypothetical protein